MKYTLLFLGLAVVSVARADFNPILITPESYNADVVFEKDAAVHIPFASTAAMDSGATNNTGNTWYERGYNRGAPATGLPVAGSTFVHASDPNKQYTMAPTYKQNNAIYINSQVTSGTLTLASPAVYANLSFLSAAGNGPLTISYTIHHADASSETGTFNSLDWFGNSPVAFTASGRVGANNGAFGNVGSADPRLYSAEISLGGNPSPVTHIDFAYTTGAGRSSIFAVSGNVSGDAYTPIAVTGYNRDVVVEAGIATTATMDGGTNNTGNTWYERGYVRTNSTSGLPPAGSLISSVSLAGHNYRLPQSYTANNAIYVDSNNPIANITIAIPTNFSALSFLSATANGTVTNQCVMQYADGTTETNTFTSKDWFNGTPFAFNANGRVDTGNRTINNVNNGNPRLYEAEFVLGNSGSYLTNVVLKWIGGSASSRVVVLAVSAISGNLPPIFAAHPQSITGFEGSSLSLTASLAGGSSPLYYQWQKGTNGVFVDVVDSGTVSGANTTNLTIANLAFSDAGQYRLVVSNSVSVINSATATLTVLSTLTDITVPSDQLTGFGGSFPANEGPDRSIDDSTTKYLNFGSGPNANAAPFVGPVGFVVTPALGLSRVTGLRFYTANDGEERDPSNYILEGSIDGGSTWTVVSSNALSLPSGRNPAGAALSPLAQNLREVLFDNALSYTSYRLSFSQVKNGAAANSFQLGEVEFLGQAVEEAPSIRQQPVSVNIFFGGTARFSVKAGGTPALSYQWKFFGEDIPGANEPTLELSNVDFSRAGAYTCEVFNPLGSALSEAANLAVIDPPAESYPASVIFDNPLAYWRLNELDGFVAYDNVGGFNGVYSNALLNTFGYSAADADPAATFGGTVPNSFVGNIQGIDFSTNGAFAAFSVEAWVRGGPQTNDAGIITKGTGAGGEQFNLDTGAPGRGFRFFVRDLANAVHLCNSTNAPDNQWHHVVGVCDLPNGYVALYVDGVLASTNAITGGIRSTPAPVTIGGRQSGTGAYDLNFVGTVDEVAIYGRALTAEQIALHYAYSGVPTLFVTANDHFRSYGGLDPEWSATFEGFINEDNESLVTGTPAFIPQADTNSPVGVYPVDLAFGTLSVAKGYKIVLQPGTLAVNTAPLTARADSKIKTPGQPNPELTVSYEGFVNGEDASILGGEPALSTAATTDSPVGVYPIDITAGTLANGNYDYSYVSGTLTVAARPELASITRSGSQFTFTYPTAAGQKYLLEYKDDLSAASWTPLGSVVAGDGNPVTASHELSAAPQRFFRLSIQP